jgi:hypothetical protein
MAKGENMDSTSISIAVIGAIIVLVVGGLLAVAFSRRQRTKQLQERFGPEYDRVVNDANDKSEAEKELKSRLEHVKALDIRPLSEQERTKFANEWRITQAKFVDEPLTALREAEALIRRVMEVKGYPVQDFDREAADISVDYPDLVPQYQGLHAIAIRKDANDISTEEMRQAIVDCRSLFEKLVGTEVNKESSVYEHEHAAQKNNIQKENM